MKTTVTLHDFREAFRTMGRSDQFTYEGQEVLFDFLEEIEQSTGEEMELSMTTILPMIVTVLLIVLGFFA